MQATKTLPPLKWNNISELLWVIRGSGRCQRVRYDLCPACISFKRSNEDILKRTQVCIVLALTLAPTGAATVDSLTRLAAHPWNSRL